jgi:hypothetical protein
VIADSMKRCNRCGSPIDRPCTGRGGHPVYCVACRKIRLTLSAIESQLKSGKRGNTYVKVAYCKQCGKPFRADRKKTFCSPKCWNERPRATHKLCNRCGETKLVGEFYFQDAKHRKRSSVCKPCDIDSRMERRGIVRKTPYGIGRCKPNPLNYCAQCGKRKSKASQSGLCIKCEHAAANELFGGAEWKRRLQRLVSKPASRLEGWNRKMETLVSSIRSRIKATGECEKKRGAAKRMMDWDERLRYLA